MNRIINFQGFILFACLITIGRILFLYNSTIELHFDEAQYWLWSKHLDFGYYSKPPMVAWVIALSGKICGDSEFCVRLPSPLLYLISSIFIFLTAKNIFSEKIAAIASLAFITLPGVSFSSILMTTDPILLLAYSAATYFLLKALDDNKIEYWFLLGVAVGIGMLSKYTIIIFYLSVFIYAALFQRKLFRNYKTYISALISLGIFLPNIIWNIKNGSVSFLHTADNLSGEGFSLSFFNLLEFLAAQVGIFGPLLSILLIFLLIVRKIEITEEIKLILLISALPMLIALITSFITRSHGNWAAPAYTGLAIIVASSAIFYFKEKFLYFALIINFITGVAFYLHPQIIKKNYIAEKLNGWEQATNEISKLKKNNYLILSDERKNLASISYYLKSDKEIFKWNKDGKINDYYDQNYDIKEKIGRNFLLISRNDIYDITTSFKKVTFIKEVTGSNNQLFKLYYMENFKGY